MQVSSCAPILLSLVVLLASTLSNGHLTHGRVSEFEWNSYRLPTSVEPVQYSIRLILDLFGDESDVSIPIPYSGLVKIALKFVESTDLIVLHSVNLNISNVKVLLNDGSDAKVLSWKIHEELEQVEVKLADMYSSKTKLNLILKFSGTVSDQLQGFYKGSYLLPNSKRRIIATTHMEAVSARKAFPCFDEPQMKAKFKMEITRPNDWNSLFNTKLIHSKVYDKSRMLDVYGFTPKMSSYLVAFVVSDFGSTEPYTVTSTIDNHTIDIVVSGRKDQMVQLEYARTTAADIISSYEEFFQVPYPLPKLDMVAIPDFPAGAMENWGLITFRESALLYDPAISSTKRQNWVTSVIAHELAHQWFGNYVTMKWWNEIWLNEGFATFVGELIGTKSFAESKKFDWPVSEDFILGVTRAIAVDGLLSTHPLSKSEGEVDSAGKIEEMFDPISYQKGSAIIHMLDTYVTRDVTKAALQDYLSSHAYSNAEASDLWQSFDKAYKAKNPHAADDEISEMMKSWIKLPGYPVLSVEAGNHPFNVTQSPFFLCKPCKKAEEEMNRLWTVPLTYRTYGPLPTKVRSVNHKHRNAVVTSEVEGTWTKLNSEWNGYYLVKYDDYSKIVISDLTDKDVANILFDTFELFKGGYVTPDVLIDLLLRLHEETDESYYLTRNIVMKSFWYLLDIFQDQPDLYSVISTQIFKWLDVRHLEVTYEAVDQMNTKQRYRLAERLKMALHIDYKKAANENHALLSLALKWRKSVVDDSVTVDKLIHKDIMVPVCICGFLLDEVDLWEKIWNKYMSTKIQSEQSTYRSVLAEGRDKKLLKKLMTYSLTKGKKDESTMIITSVAIGKSGREVAWRFVKAHWNTLYKKFGSVGLMINGLIILTASKFSDQSKLAEVKEFFNSVDASAGKMAITQSTEHIQANMYMVTENSEAILASFLQIEADDWNDAAAAAAWCWFW